MNFKTFLIGFLILLLTPLLVIGGFWACTHWYNQRPQAGLLQCAVAPEMVWTGEPTTYTVTFLGDTIARPANQPPKPLDMIFVVDVSPSMGQIFSEMAKAAQAVAKNLQPNNVRFALVSFREFAKIEVPWTTDPNALYTGLNGLAVSDGGTDGRTTFPPIGELLATARAEANKLIVFYTDGIIFQDERLHTSPAIGTSPGEGEIHRSEDHSIADNAEALRNNQGIKIFVLMPPLESQHFDASDSMVLLTGDPSQVFRLESLQNLEHQLEKQFQVVAETAIGTYAGGADIEHRLDGNNFSIPRRDTVGELNSTWQTENRPTENQNIEVFRQHLCYLPFKREEYKHTLIPQRTGLWEVGLAPPEMIYSTPQNEPKMEKCERRPLLLVLSPWLLLFFLPALFWLLNYLYQLLRKITVAKREYLAPPIYPMSSPSPLPAPVPPPTRSVVVPTLFIGLGGTGRQALYAIQQNLAFRVGETSVPSPQVQFLWLDVDSGEQEKKMPFADAESSMPVREVVAPVTIRQVAQYLPVAHQPLPTHLAWFRPQEYLDTSRATLDLSRGSGGRRALARLALFQWLATSSELGDLLKGEIEVLLKQESVDGLRQIVLLADRTGGVGSGWLIDMARLLRRLTRLKTRPAVSETTKVSDTVQNFVPEIVGVLCSSGSRPTPQQQQNSQALLTELETAQKVGAFPQRVTYAEKSEEWFDQVDQESPFNWQFSVTGKEVTEVAMQGAELSAVLIERSPRWTLLHHRLNQGQLLSVQAKSIRVMPELNYQWVKQEILKRVLGPDVLLDLQPDVAGVQWVVAPLSGNQVEQLLGQWAAIESKGTPWQLLLNASLSQTGQRLFLEVAKERGHPERVWFQRAFAASLSRQLRGPRGKGRWLPGEAVAVLRLLAERLETQVRPVATGTLADILAYVAELARHAATQLQRWLAEFMPLCEKLGKQQLGLLQQREFFKTVAGQVFLDKEMDLQRVRQSSQEALQRWVGSVDVIAALGEHLFFTVRAEKEGLIITLALYVEERQEFIEAKSVVAMLESYADRAARQVPTLRIAGALATLEEAQVKQLARALVDIDRRAGQVLMVMPNVSGEEKNAQEAMRRFRQAVVEPAGQATPDDCEGEDRSAVRRLEVRPEELLHGELMMDRLPFVQAAEQAAEEIRRQAETQFEMQIPLFPPALRLALSQPVAFRSFSRAYKAGHIVQKLDVMGVTQWWFTDTGDFLTFGKDNSLALAVAAANYAYLVKSPPEDFPVEETPGDFSELDRWQQQGGVPGDKVSVLIAIKAVGASET